MTTRVLLQRRRSGSTSGCCGRGGCSKVSSPLPLDFQSVVRGGQVESGGAVQTRGALAQLLQFNFYVPELSFGRGGDLSRRR